MLCVQEVQLVAVLVGPHGNVDRIRLLRDREIAVLGQLVIGFGGGQGVQHSVFTEISNADTIAGGASIQGTALEGGGPQSVPCLHGDGHGIDLAGAMDTPAAGSIVFRIVLQRGPQVQTGAQLLRQLQKTVSQREHRLGSDHNISGDIGNGDLAICINLRGDVSTAHGDGHSQILTGNGFLKLGTGGNALVVMLACAGRGQLVGNGINLVFSRFHFALAQQNIQHSRGNVVHTGSVGMNAVRQFRRGNAAIPQIRIGNAVMLANLGHDSVGLSQLFIGIVRGGDRRQQCHDLGIGIIMPHPQKGVHKAIRQIVPLCGGQIYRGRCSRCIEAAHLADMGQIVGAAIKQDDVRRAVGTQILNAHQIAHGSIFTGGAGGHRRTAAKGRAPPAVVDAQLGIQLRNDLHPPSLIHIRQQIILRIPRQMLQIEAVGGRNVTGKGGDRVTHNGDDLAGEVLSGASESEEHRHLRCLRSPRDRGLGCRRGFRNSRLRFCRGFDHGRLCFHCGFRNTRLRSLSSCCFRLRGCLGHSGFFCRRCGFHHCSLRRCSSVTAERKSLHRKPAHQHCQCQQKG